MPSPSSAEFVVTLDIDWAPDFVIDEVASILESAAVRATWFVTHASAAVDRLAQRADLFELGAHPNFLPGSSHGADIAAVLDHVEALVPTATSVRTHGLYQSGAYLAAIAQRRQLTTDVSLFLPGLSRLRPFRQWLVGGSIVRVPYTWADDHELLRPARPWSLDQLDPIGGPKVLDFHPIHIYLNSADPAAYARLRAACPDLTRLRPDVASEHVNPTHGTRTLFEQVVQRLARNRSWVVRELAQACTADV